MDLDNHIRKESNCCSKQMKWYPEYFSKEKEKIRYGRGELEENKHRKSTKFNGLNLSRVGGGAGKEIHATLVHTFSTFPVA